MDQMTSSPAASATSSGSETSSTATTSAAPESAPNTPSSPSAPTQSAGFNGNFADVFNQTWNAIGNEETSETDESPTVETGQGSEPGAGPAVTADPATIDFSLNEPVTGFDKLYSADEFNALAESSPEQAWQYAQSAARFLHENAETMDALSQMAERVGGIEALQPMADIAAALYGTVENPQQVIQQTLRLLEGDGESAPLNQLVSAVAQSYLPEMLTAASANGLQEFLTGQHYLLDPQSWGPRNQQEYYLAQAQVEKLQAQRTALLEALAPAVYQHYGNDFELRDQYNRVGKGGEFYGLQQNTIDPTVRESIQYVRPDLVPVYEQLDAAKRARWNQLDEQDLVERLETEAKNQATERKLADLEAKTNQQAETFTKQAEEYRAKQAEGRVKQFESGVWSDISTRLSKYGITPYGSNAILRGVKEALANDPTGKAQQLFDAVKDAAKANNQPLVSQLMQPNKPLPLLLETLVRRELAAWQQETGRAAAPPAKQPNKLPTVPQYPKTPTTQPARTNGNTAAPLPGDFAAAVNEAVRKASLYTS